jgi:hypothetical protein
MYIYIIYILILVFLYKSFSFQFFIYVGKLLLLLDMTINISSNKALRKMLNENDLTKIRTHEIVFSRYKVEEVMKGGERVGRQSTPLMNSVLES